MKCEDEFCIEPATCIEIWQNKEVHYCELHALAMRRIKEAMGLD